jgi:hypothetical protein
VAQGFGPAPIVLGQRGEYGGVAKLIRLISKFVRLTSSTGRRQTG